MGLKRLADARFAPLWVLLLIVAGVVLAVQLNSDSEPMPEPVLTKPDRPVDTEQKVPARDRVSPLKDGSGT